MATPSLAPRGPLPPVQASDTVRAVLARFPATLAVFEARGLLGCGGAAGPDEPIELFAAVHHVDPAALLAELNEAARRPVASAAPAGPAEPGDELYRPFLRASLLCTITLGASFGADNLYRIHFATGPVPAAHNWIHAGFQVFGFVLLAIMGVSYHALPRFLGRPLAAPGLARATLWLGLGGLLLTGYGRFAHFVPGAVPALAAGAILQFSAIALWAWILWRTAGAVEGRRDPSLAAIAAGTAWWLVAGALLLAAALRAALTGNADAAARLNEAVYAAALYGGAVAWIQGMLWRTAPLFLGLGEPPARRLRLALLLGQAGALLAVAGGLRPGAAASLRLGSAGLLFLAASAVAFLLALRPHRLAAPRHFAGSDPWFAPILRLAFASYALFAVLGLAYGLSGLRGRVPSQFVFDGARHALGLGFFTLAIVAMGGRILPIFAGRDLAWPRLRAAGALLIFAGLLGREAQLGAVLLDEPGWLAVSGVSGFVAASGVLLAAASLLATLGRRGAAGEVPAPAPAAHALPISTAANVAALVAGHPEALAILIEAGFTPLANPVLRRTLARAVTLAQASAMHGLDAEALAARIRAACPAEGRTGWREGPARAG